VVFTIDKDCDGWQCDVGMVLHVLEWMNPGFEGVAEPAAG
jgi:hypothetical protein